MAFYMPSDNQNSEPATRNLASEMQNATMLSSANEQALDLSIRPFICERCRETFPFEHHLVAHRNWANCNGLGSGDKAETKKDDGAMSSGVGPSTAAAANAKPLRPQKQSTPKASSSTRGFHASQSDLCCPQCNRRVANCNSLAFHIAAKHHGVKPLIRCKYPSGCQEVFTTVSAAMRHIRRVHYHLPVNVREIIQFGLQDVPDMQQHLEVVDDVREITKILKQQSTSGNQRCKRRATEALDKMKTSPEANKAENAPSSDAAASTSNSQPLQATANTSASPSTENNGQPLLSTDGSTWSPSILAQYKRFRQLLVPIDISAAFHNTSRALEQQCEPWLGQLEYNSHLFTGLLHYYYGDLELINRALPHFARLHENRDHMGLLSICNQLVFLQPAYEAFVQSLAIAGKTVSMIVTPYGLNIEEMAVNSDAIKAAFRCDHSEGHRDGFTQIMRPNIKYNIYAFYVDASIEEVLQLTTNQLMGYFSGLAKVLLVIEACRT